MFRHIIFGAMLAGSVQLGAQAVVFGNAQSEALAQQGAILLTQGKLKEAREQFELAVKADPTASHPVSSLGMLYYVLSNDPRISAEHRQEVREAAHSLAARAIAIDGQDPLAQEVARLLAAPEGSRYQPQGNAGELASQGEVLFSKKDFKGALEKYEQAVAADPHYADAWLYAGDCYFSMKQWAEAETRFRKAAELAPLHDQAWRFLADALNAQQKWPEMELALASAIGAHPDQVTAWQRMAQFQRGHGAVLSPLGLKVKARGRIDPKTGGMKVEMQPKAADDKNASPVDNGFWMILALSQAAGELKAQEGSMTPFAIDLAAWQAAFDAVAGMEAKESLPLQDPALLALRKLAEAGELEAALLLLQYREDYRPELEAWKTTHPEGVRKFINVHHLMP